MSELIAMTATEVVGLLRAGEVSSHELLDALERRIAAVDGAEGALPTLCFDSGLTTAPRPSWHGSTVFKGTGD